MAGQPPPDSRPLSPHLQVWRPHLTMAASITHRITGFGLYLGTFLIAAWLAALAFSPEAFGVIRDIMQSWFGRAALFLWAVAVLFHLANGLRHLLWDGPGIGFDPKLASAWSAFNYAFAFAGAAALWYAATLL